MTKINRENFRKELIDAVNQPNKVEMTRELAQTLLLNYWNENGIPTIKEELNHDDIKDIMNGDLTRLMIDPHKYAHLDEEEMEEEEEEEEEETPEEKIKARIQQLKDDLREHDGDNKSYLVAHNDAHIEINILENVLHVMNGGDFEDA